MTEHVGQVLKALRKARGYSLRQLAGKATVNGSPIGGSTLANIEAGRRTMSTAMALACDRVLGTHLLNTIISEGDPLKRRTLIASATSLLAAGAVAPGIAAEAVRLGFEDSPNGVDYDARIADYRRDLATQPDNVFGANLLGDLAAHQQAIRTGRASLDQYRTVALLANIFGLYQGNLANLPDARSWYGTAINLADASADTTTQVWTRGRAASRAIYEGLPMRRVVGLAQQALHLSDRASYGMVEAHSALVHVHALTGNLGRGREAIEGMARTADDLLVTVAGPHQRVLVFQTYLEGRVGDLRSAQRAYDTAQPELCDLPHWRTDTDLYLALGLIRSGDVEDGLQHALTAMRDITAPDRVLALGVRDVVQHVPAGHRSDTLDELATYASTEAGPWEMITR